MSEECIQASPVSQKRRWPFKKQTRRRESKRYKKCNYSTTDINATFCPVAEEIQSGSTTELSTILEEILKDSMRGSCSPTKYLNLLYEGQISDAELEQEQVHDIFARDRLLEKAAQAPYFPIAPRIKEGITNFSAVCSLPNVEVKDNVIPPSQCGVKVEESNLPCSQSLLISETQFAKLCEVPDVLVDIKIEDRNQSERASPLKRSPEPNEGCFNQVLKTEILFRNSIAQNIWDDFSEFCTSSPSPPPPSPETRIVQLKSPTFKIRTKIVRTYSRKRPCKENNTNVPGNSSVNIPKKQDDDCDSDAESILASELSVQDNEVMDCTPIKDNLDLNKSIRVCENLNVLSSFFSQSFTDENASKSIDIDDVYNHVMQVKFEQEETKLLDWNGIPDLKDFQYSNKSESVHDLFEDDDDEIFEKFKTCAVVNNAKESAVEIAVKSEKDSVNAMDWNEEDKVTMEIAYNSKENQELEVNEALKVDLLTEKANCKREQYEEKCTATRATILIDKTNISAQNNSKLENKNEKSLNSNILPLSKIAEITKNVKQEENLMYYNANESIVKSQRSKLSLGKKGCSSLRSNISNEERISKEIIDEFGKCTNILGEFKLASGKQVLTSKNALSEGNRLFTEINDEIITSEDFITNNKEKEMSSEFVSKTIINHPSTSKQSLFKVSNNNCLQNVKHQRNYDKKIEMDKVESTGNCVEEFHSLAKNDIWNDADLNFVKSSTIVKDKIISTTSFNAFNNCGSNFAGGFQTGSLKDIKISEKTLKKAQNLYKDIEQVTVEKDKKEAESFQVPAMQGFQIASSKMQSSMSKKAMQRAQKLYNEIQSEPEDSTVQNIKSESKIPSVQGFQIASGRNLSICKKAMNRAQQLYNEIKADSNVSAVENIKMEPKISSIQGFQIASGKNFAMSKKAMERAKQLYNEIQSEPEDSTVQNIKSESKIPSVQGFQIASGRNLSICKKAMNRAQQLHNEIKADSNISAVENIKMEPKISSIQGFQIASGKNFAMSKKAMQRAQQLYNEVQVEAVDFTKENIKMESKVPLMQGFQIASGKNFTMTKTAMERAQQLYSEVQIDTEKPTAENVIMGSKISSVSSGKNFSLSKKALEKAQQLYNEIKVENEDSTVTLENKIPKRCDTPVRSNKPVLRSSAFQEEKNISTPSNKIKKAFNTTPNLKEFFNSVETSTPFLEKRKDKFSLTQEISGITAVLFEDDDFQEICWNGFDESIKENIISNKNHMNAENVSISPEETVIQISEKIKQSRLKLRENQLDIIRKKQSSVIGIIPGSLYVKKKQFARNNWANIVGDQKPKFLSLQDSKIADINFSNAINFKFNGAQFYPDIGNIDSIKMIDNIEVIPDDYNKIGLYEIEQAFLCMNGVSPALIPTNWISHHYKMILLKLFRLEKFFPDTLSNQLCTPENVILQLKYRYDREIDLAERSILKKILETDDSPAKRMVLIVIEIYKNGIEMELELSDGWYTIRTTLDSAMHNLIRSGKVRLGTKLMIQSAELLNCENGCSPLEIPAQVRLKIHTNSTRRAKWDIKLGLYKIPKPFLINLRSVKENGGLITRLRLYIVRTYPLVYLNKRGNVQGVHSEKVERRFQSRDEKIDFDNFELIFSSIQKEMEAEEQIKKRKIKNQKRNISNIEDPQELYELIQNGFDLEDLGIELTEEKQKHLLEYQEEISSRKIQEIHSKVQDRLKDRSNKVSSIEILKVRVMDSSSPEFSTILSIWRPQEYLRSMLQEGVCFEISNCTSSGIRYGNMQLNSTKSSQYKFLPGKKLPLTLAISRKITPISDINVKNFSPQFNEIDTCGLVVHITNLDLKRFQSVYISDIAQNIVCINFWNGMKEYAYDDILRNNNFILATNLQWRTHSGNGSISSLFVTEFSMFIENPKIEYFLHAFNEMKEKFKDIDLIEFSSECLKKIETLKGHSFATPVRRPFTSVNTSSTLNTSVSGCCLRNSAGKSCHIASPQNRIEHLEMYGEPPPISPLVLKYKRSARKAFKIPLLHADEDN